MQIILAIIAIVLFLILFALYLLNFTNRIKTSYEFIMRETLGNEALVRHARGLAQGTRTASYYASTYTPALRRNAEELSLLVKRLGSVQELGAGEWIVDNFYTIMNEFTELSAVHLKGMPIVLNGAGRGMPRAEWLACELVAHSDGSIDEDRIVNYIDAFTEQMPLSMRESRAFLLFVRVALSRGIGNVTNRLNEILDIEEIASDIAERLLKKPQLETLTHVPRSSRDVLKPVCCERLLHLLLESNHENSDQACAIVRRYVAQESLSTDILIKEAQNEYAQLTAITGNIIKSFKLVGQLKSDDIYERICSVEKVLRKDISGVYPRIDKDSRFHYKKTIEEIAMRINSTELRVATEAMELSAQQPGIRSHIGYYLISDGVNTLIRNISGKNNWKPTTYRRDSHARFRLYTGSIVIVSLILSILAGWAAYRTSLLCWQAAMVFLLSYIIFTGIVINLINRIVSNRVRISFIPKMDFSDGIPADQATLVVVPTLLSDANRVAESIEKLELHYLSNRSENLYFALLGDFPDSNTRETDNDSEIVRRGMNAVRELNSKYDKKLFYYLQRPRVWSDGQRKWMGYERKRGALLQLARMIRGYQENAFLEIDDYTNLTKCRYLLTLDADTILGIDNAHKMVGAMAHPLNTPIMDEEHTKVVRGHGILQPGVDVQVTAASRSKFAQLYAGRKGIEPYSFVVSDLYQDLFDTGIFVGKGILDIYSFIEVTSEQIRPGRILSHDLLEGCLLRAGLVSDVRVSDGFPSNYAVYASRSHRWTRGDWQLLPWLCSHIRNAQGKRKRNPLDALSKWKILDNLRRSMTSPAIFLLFLFAFTVFQGNIALYVTIAAVSIFLPFLTETFGRLIQYIKHREAGFVDILVELKNVLLNVLTSFAYLAYEAYFMLDAAIRTLSRLSRGRGLLEWVVAADSERKFRPTLGGYMRKMWPAIFWALVLFVGALVWKKHETFAFALAVCWCASPLLAYGSGLPILRHRNPFSKEEKDYLHMLARRTWAYYVDFVTEEHSFLPPDNYQEQPEVGAAPRTSPTNIGMYLMACLSAVDLGFISYEEMSERLSRTVSTMEKAEKWNGHLLNWYDTRNLEPLRPEYVSAVDSGNLAGYIMTVAEGLQSSFQASLLRKERIQGLIITLHLMVVEYKHRGLNVPQITDAIQSLTGVDSMLALREALHNVARILKNSKFRLAEKELDSIHHSIQEINHVLPYLNLLSDVPDTTYDHDTQVKVNGLIELLKAADSREKASCYATKGRIIIGEIKELLREKNQEFARQLTVWLDKLDAQLGLTLGNGKADRRQCDKLRMRLQALADAMDFTPLYDAKAGLFYIGYDLHTHQMSNSHYDLFASEARQTGFVAIAKGDVPMEHWFRMGRPVRRIGDMKMLMSWSGTMFEYLMPSLIMKTFNDTLIEETNGAAVMMQRHYGISRHIPWGISESGFYSFDSHMAYQYKAFGVPGMGMKTHLGDDAVISPYATVMALGVAPLYAFRNILNLVRTGGLGYYGLYEAIDFTPERTGHSAYKVVQSYMAHHQGIILIALNNALSGNIMIERFHSIPEVRSIELLLQEMIPQSVSVKKVRPEEQESVSSTGAANTHRIIDSPHVLPMETQLYSNGQYTLMLNAAGGGYSKCDDVTLTHWRKELTGECFGYFFYIRNLNTGDVWSSTHQPLLVDNSSYRAVFSEDKAVFSRIDGQILTETSIIVSPEENAEIRSVKLKNNGDQDVRIEVTSYIELTLNRWEDDLAHRAYSNLFLETEYWPELNAVAAVRRKKESRGPVAAHMLLDNERVEFETDRLKFLGRGRTPNNPAVMAANTPLTMSAGAVILPCLSLRRRLVIPAGEEKILHFALIYAEHPAEARRIAAQMKDLASLEHLYDLALSNARMAMQHLHIHPAQAVLYQRLAGRLLYKQASNRSGGKKDLLWALGISGDIPIALVIIKDYDALMGARLLTIGQSYLRAKGFVFDYVFLTEEESGYFQPIRDRLSGYVSGLVDPHAPGALHIVNRNAVDPALVDNLMRCAAVILDASKPLSQQIMTGKKLPRIEAPQIDRKYEPSRIPLTETGEFDNEYGMFTDNGREYLIRMDNGRNTPMPWSNVIANKRFGTLVTERGGGYTWALNSRQNKLTNWSNDPVGDPLSEVLFLRDNETGAYWSITPGPVRRQGDYIVRHGRGYSSFEYNGYGLQQKMTVFCPVSQSVKCCLVTLKNTTNTPRKLSAFYYADILLNAEKDSRIGALISGIDKVLWFQNADAEFQGVAWVGFDGIPDGCTDNRMEFIGLNHMLSNPVGLRSNQLSGLSGHAECAVLQKDWTLQPEEELEFAVFLGFSETVTDAENICNALSEPGRVRRELTEAMSFWDTLTDRLVVNSGNRAMDILVNKWLPYQVLSSRVYGRTGFYQSGGGWGFRDQLQDMLALMYTMPELARRYLLDFAQHQFPEGDVQHWWHQPARGVRTSMSDDKLFLPYITDEYVRITGDVSILEECIPYLNGEPLGPNEHSKYNCCQCSPICVTLYEHCNKAIDHALRFGKNGLPLMGTGDWNDAMDSIGDKGIGESVWLACFLYDVLCRFADLGRMRGETLRAETLEKQAVSLRENIEKNAWDGEWYIRAYDDEGRAIGAAQNSECRLDALSQAWATISGAANVSRARQALDSVMQLLFHTEDATLALLTPAFNGEEFQPGNIAAYLPGVRENGGQYTHAAVWVVMALAIQDRNDEAWMLANALNPINHSLSEGLARKYMTEPYVMAADVYTRPPNNGRGGWTWYTGSAAWMYKVVVESLIGFQKEGNILRFAPHLPSKCEGIELEYKFTPQTVYKITIYNPGRGSGVRSITLDGKQVEQVELTDDGIEHKIKVTLESK